MTTHAPEPWRFFEKLAFRHRDRPGVREVEGVILDAAGGLVCEIGPIAESNLRRLLAHPDVDGELLAAAESVAVWLLARAVHYQGLGSDNVSAGLAAQADVLCAVIARARGESPPAKQTT